MRASRWLVAAGLLLAACNADDVAPERLPRFEAPHGPAPRVALVLGSGGPRGFAHIGVLKVLDEQGIRPDLIVGSSVGAMVGALYAAGMSGVELEKLARGINVIEFFEFRMLGGGPASGTAIQAYVNAHVGGKPIEALGIPFVAAATHLPDHKLTLFNRGDTGLAVRASSASPGQFSPVRIGQDEYVDGDLASPVPLRAARSLGAKLIIAIDVSAFENDTPPGVPQAWIDNDARRARQVAAETTSADIVLHPNIGYYAGHDEAYRTRVMAAAERYAREQVPAIRAAFARAGMPLAPSQNASTVRIPAGEASR
jgi:NTE family protein